MPPSIARSARAIVVVPTPPAIPPISGNSIRSPPPDIDEGTWSVQPPVDPPQTVAASREFERGRQVLGGPLRGGWVLAPDVQGAGDLDVHGRARTERFAGDDTASVLDRGDALLADQLLPARPDR